MTDSGKSIADYFVYTGKYYEESGSNIRIYKCLLCDEEVNKYSMSMHLYMHEEVDKL